MLKNLGRKAIQIVFTLLFVTLLIVYPTAAQESDPRNVTDDQVNAIAHGLYCPVCENITLDVCGTAACADWRAEIRTMLEAGWTEQQIVDDFVRRFGDRVVGTPQDPVLRTLSLVTPWILIGLGGLTTVLLFNRWRRAHPVTATGTSESTDRYHDLLEQDISG